jgi:hypothetical protein
MNVAERVISHSIAQEFSRAPGPRFRKEGAFSGEQFRDEVLAKWFSEAQNSESKLFIDLDGGYGYAPSFLEEAFGGLARIHGTDRVLGILRTKSDEEPYLRERIEKYIREANG